MTGPIRWELDPAPSRAVVEEIAAVIRGGGVVILPTDTLYGLHAAARDASAIGRIQLCKGRDGGKPLLVLCASCRDARDLGAAIDDDLARALDAIWPAPLTAILPLAHPIAASAGTMTLGVRIPAVDWLRELATITGPIASTSVNRAGEVPSTSAETIPPNIAAVVDGIADAGPLEGTPSTIVDFTTDPPTILRKGDFDFSQELWKTARKSL
jgi:L-threonylcarbamoyladenylate synthase